MNGRRVGRTR